MFVRMTTSYILVEGNCEKIWRTELAFVYLRQVNNKNQYETRKL